MHKFTEEEDRRIWGLVKLERSSDIDIPEHIKTSYELARHVANTKLNDGWSDDNK